mgnify:CR=1 FL=1
MNFSISDIGTKAWKATEEKIANVSNSLNKATLAPRQKFGLESAGKFNVNKYKIDQHSYPIDLLEPKYGGNYVVFYINVSDDSKLNVLENTVKLDEGTEKERSLWPEFWPLEELKAKKAALDIRYWNAQYLQNPVSEEGALIKREWWRIWDKDTPPQCEFTIMSLDAAQEKSNRADYNALTTWGVFYNEETKNHNIILLNSIKKRMEYPELKKLVLEEYAEWKPDSFIVEKKSSGTALYQELRRMGIPVGEYTPHRGSGDKLARLNSVADIVRSRLCWVPQTRWAEEVVEEIAGFPFMTHDDLVDTVSMAIRHLRDLGLLARRGEWALEALVLHAFQEKGAGGIGARIVFCATAICAGDWLGVRDQGLVQISDRFEVGL